MKKIILGFIILLSVLGHSFASDSSFQINATGLISAEGSLFEDDYYYSGATVDFRFMASNALGIDAGIGIYKEEYSYSGFEDKYYLDIFAGFVIQPFNNGYISFSLSPMCGIMYDTDYLDDDYYSDLYSTVWLGIECEGTIRISKNISIDVGVLWKLDCETLFIGNIERKWTVSPNIGLQFDL